MPLRLFGASTRVRICPGCERDLQPDATFCPSCYMVFRPEGVSALREYLQGARIPTDVYLLRRLQSQDPDAGPVTVAPAPAAEAPPLDTAPPLPEAPASPAPPPSASVAPPLAAPAPDAAAAPPPLASGGSGLGAKQGVDGLLQFRDPLPPAASRPAEVAELYAWMLDHDPVIPNNLQVLQAIHGAVFSQSPFRRLGYEHHVALLVADDAALFASAEAHSVLLGQLAAAYRRASEAYRMAGEDESAANRALWEMASLATRLRLGAWIFSTRYGQSPELLSTRQRELPLRFGEP
jgi:hypothetical protein